MTMHRTDDLYKMLHETLIQISTQIDATMDDALKHIATLPYPGDTTPYMIKNRDGKFILTELIAAKGQVLSAMAALKAADMQSKAAARKR